MLIDIHSHCNFSGFKKDAPEVIKRAIENNIHMILVGSQYSTSLRACQMSQEYKEGVYAAVGLHPVQLFEIDMEEEGHRFRSRKEELDLNQYQKLIDDYDKVVAVGEIGLDFHWLDKTKPGIAQTQFKALHDQFNLAYENKLPTIIHCRKGHDELLEQLTQLVKNKPKGEYGVIHSYYGNYNRAMAYIELGFLISFTGIVTYNDSTNSLIRRLPANKIMVETDCPYLAPEPKKAERNEPLYVQYVLDKVAQVRGVNSEEMAGICTANVQRLFRI